MIDYLNKICKFPFSVIILSWSFLILIGMYWQKKSRNSESKIIDTIVSYSELSGKVLLYFGFVYFALLTLGVYTNSTIRWIIIGISIALILLLIIVIGASTEFSIKVLPKENKSLYIPIFLLITIFSITIIILDLWLLKVFVNYGI